MRAPRLVRVLPIAVLAGLAWAGLPATLAAQAHAGHAQEKLGRVEFPVSCTAEARAELERGVALLHSFFFEAADEAFDAVLARDPSCAMAYWGKALRQQSNPFAGLPSEAASKAGLEAAERGLAMAPKTERERGYLNAIATLYRDYATTQGRARRAAYEEAMLALAAKYPEDVEATIFYAQALIANAPPTDQTYAKQLQATKLLEPLFATRPNHPGLAHYLIHAYDAPPIAEGGLGAATRYASIAPSAPHALHMPSHIFTRLGMWDASIETNRRAADSERSPGWKAHPLDYMVYAYLQQGRDEAAKKALDEMAVVAGVEGVVSYNFAAMPARYALERERWADAASLEVRSAPGTVAEAVTRFARGIGAARSGELAKARAEAEALARIQKALTDGGQADWALRVEAQRLAVASWIAYGEGKRDEALAHAEEAAAIEDRVEKHPVTPGPLLPARELQGDLLMEAGRSEEALEAYEAALAREPNRARSLYGAARAAEAAGKKALAAKRYGEYVALMAEGDGTRPGLAHARTFLSGE